MEVDPDVIAALEAVVDRDPGNLALGVHLASLLLDAGRPEDALRRCHVVLERAPADRGAQATADQAARAAGRPHLRLL